MRFSFPAHFVRDAPGPGACRGPRRPRRRSTPRAARGSSRYAGVDGWCVDEVINAIFTVKSYLQHLFFILKPCLIVENNFLNYYSQTVEGGNGQAENRIRICLYSTQKRFEFDALGRGDWFRFVFFHVQWQKKFALDLVSVR